MFFLFSVLGRSHGTHGKRERDRFTQLTERRRGEASSGPGNLFCLAGGPTINRSGRRKATSDSGKMAIDSPSLQENV